MGDIPPADQFPALTPMRLAVIFHRLGPYHWARLTATARRFDLTVIEQAAETAEYAWDKVGGESGFTRRTLFAADEPAASQRTAMAARTHAALDELRPDAIAIPGWSNRGGLAALGWALSEGVPAVIMSESTAGDHRRARWKEWPKRRLVGLCPAALAGGTPHRRYLQGLGMAADRIFLGYDAVDNAHFRAGADAARRDPAARERLGLPARYFLASNRFLPQKNLLFLLDGLFRYRVKAGPDARDLVLLGDGPVRAELQAGIDRLGLAPHVVLPGFRQYDALPAYYGLADAFVHTATSEPWGLVVNEAMAAGLPTIVSANCGCAFDLVEAAVNGFIFDPSNVDEFAARLLHVGGLSAAGRETMGRAAQERIALWSPERFAGGMVDAVHAALAAPRPRPSLLDRTLLRLLAGSSPA